MGQIKLGMHVLRADGRVGVVTGWKVVPGTKTMYNLEVAQDHTFTVGAGQWVVHNCGNFPQQADQEAKQLLNVAEPNFVGKWFTTIGVAYVEDSEGNISRLVSMNSGAVNATRVNRLMGVLSPGEWVDPAGSGLDAEQNLLRYIEGRGLIIRGLGASRDICMDKCWPEIVNAGVIDVVGTPNRGGTWIPFWMR